MAVLAGIGLAAIVALMVMGVLYFLTEMDFKKVFMVSAGVGLLAPLLLAIGIGGALADGSADDTQDDTFELTREGSSVVVRVNQQEQLRQAINTFSGVDIQGSSDNDQLVVDFSGGHSDVFYEVWPDQFGVPRVLLGFE